MILNKLNLFLARKNITGSKLAAQTGIAQSTISKIVNNTTTQIDYETLNKFCIALDITPGEFFDFSPIEVFIDESLIINSRDIDNHDLEFELNNSIYFTLEVTKEKQQYLIPFVAQIGEWHEATTKSKNPFLAIKGEEREIVSYNVDIFPTKPGIANFKDILVYLASLSDELRNEIQKIVILGLKEKVNDELNYSFNQELSKVEEIEIYLKFLG